LKLNKNKIPESKSEMQFLKIRKKKKGGKGGI